METITVLRWIHMFQCKRIRRGFWVAILVLSFVLSPVEAGYVPVAVDAKGERLAVAATLDGRVVQVASTKDLAVTHRFYIPRGARNLCLSRDGRVLAIADSLSLQLKDIATGKIIKVIGSEKTRASIHHVCFAPSVDQAAYVYFDSKTQSRGIALISITDGNLVSSFPLPKGVEISRLAISPDGKQVAAYHTNPKKKVPQTPPPVRPKKNRTWKQMREFDFQKAVHRQKNDGRTATILIFDTSSGRERARFESWYTLSLSRSFPHLFQYDGQTIYFLPFNSECATIDKEGEIQMIGKHTLNVNGFGFSPNAQWLAVGSLGKGSLYRGMTRVAAFEPDRTQQLPIGFARPEYYHSVGVTNDGRAYFYTTGHRIVEVDAKGKVLRVKPLL
jgi:hypothetical protein